MGTVIGACSGHTYKGMHTKLLKSALKAQVKYRILYGKIEIKKWDDTALPLDSCLRLGVGDAFS